METLIYSVIVAAISLIFFVMGLKTGSLMPYYYEVDDENVQSAIEVLEEGIRWYREHRRKDGVFTDAEMLQEMDARMRFALDDLKVGLIYREQE